MVKILSRKNPWESESSPWKTETAFWNYVRGGLRRSLWKRNPIKLNLIRSKRFKAPIGRNGKSVWAGVCEQCGGTFRQPELEVDHLVGAGSLRSLQDLAGFIERLVMVDETSLQLVDKECHRIRSYAERYSISFEEAKIR